MSQHTITYAGTILAGNAYREGYAKDYQGSRGVLASIPVYVSLGAVAIADPNGIATAQAVASAGNLTLDGALASGGTVTFDTPRAVEIDSSSTDTTQTATVTGTDVNGAAMTEDIAFNGTTAVAGQKAFATVTQVAIDILLAGNATCGSTDVLGLPYAISDKNQVTVRFDGADDSATIVVGDTTTATSTTNDVRGTINIAGTLNGTKTTSVTIFVDRSSANLAHGVAQA